MLCAALAAVQVLVLQDCKCFVSGCCSCGRHGLSEFPLMAHKCIVLAYRCIIDRQQKQFDAESCRLLCNFAEIVVQEILKQDARVRLITSSYIRCSHA